MVDLQVKSKKVEGTYKIFDEIAKNYDFLNHLLSGGIDKRWRLKLVKNLPQKQNLVVLDVACGTGDLSIALTSSPMVKKIIGIDLSTKMLDIGKEKILKLHLGKKIDLQVRDGADLQFESEFDVVTIAFGIRNFNDVPKGLQSMYDALKTGGQLMVMEFSLPKSKILRAAHLFYFRRILPFVGNLISGHIDAYTYLNKSVEDFPYGDKFLKLMSDAKFQKLKTVSLTGGIATIYIGEKLVD